MTKEVSVGFLPAVSSSHTQKRRITDKLIEILLFIAALSSVLTTFGIMEILVGEAWQFFQKVTIAEFLTSTEWTPLFAEPKYGILPLISGTLVTTGVALVLAIPLGTIIAIYLSEFASDRLREIIKPILEILAGIPSVVYGYFALLFVTPLLQFVILEVQKILMPGLEEFDYYILPGFNMLSAGLVMGISIVPFISSISEDAMRAVPLQMREGSYAMGATRLQTAINVVLPSAISGIMAAYILGISRAIGQTMIVAIAAGLQPTYTWNPLDSAATISTYIVQVSQGDIARGTVEYQTIFAAGLTLVLITLLLNIIGFFLTKRFREVY
ncbi:MAG: phosphate ABC transporter permease subunit PstC [Pseudanabaena sp.]|nr:MAG: phosphate ABC transporter permease subunit PstC [Pseudanabaena sp.]